MIVVARSFSAWHSIVSIHTILCSCFFVISSSLNILIGCSVSVSGTGKLVVVASQCGSEGFVGFLKVELVWTSDGEAREKLFGIS